MMRAALERRLQALWYGNSRAYRLMLPLSWLFCAAVAMRRHGYRSGLLKSVSVDARVIIVGNIVVGGGGKTPLVIALAEHLRAAGFRVGLLCGGYRGRARTWPQAVTTDSDPVEVGDEAVLLARRTGLPVMAGPDRVAAAQALLDIADCDVLISDDGLQHYRLQRDLEIAAVDPQRRFGNAACLPAGPLREPLSRLAAVTAVVGMGGEVEAATSVATLVATTLHNLHDPQETRPLDSLAGQTVHAVAGIAHPQRFFERLQSAGLHLQRHSFSDHHRFTPHDLPGGAEIPVLMTEKDAVKCQSIPRPNCWYLPIEARPEAALVDGIIRRISATES